MLAVATIYAENVQNNMIQVVLNRVRKV